MNTTNEMQLLLPLALQPAVGFGLSNNTSPFFPVYHQLSPSSHSQHLKISFHFFSPSLPGSSSSSRPFQFLSEDLFGHPILPHSLQVTLQTYPYQADRSLKYCVVFLKLNLFQVFFTNGIQNFVIFRYWWFPVSCVLNRGKHFPNLFYTLSNKNQVPWIFF